jgi:DNA invertase Pin-like site-specific DNA recombinase
MSGALIGYARCSTDAQDLTAQRQRLIELGASEERIYFDHGLTGTNRERPGLDQALAAVRAGDTLVVPKLDRLARSAPGARAISDAFLGELSRIVAYPEVENRTVGAGAMRPYHPTDHTFG